MRQLFALGVCVLLAVSSPPRTAWIFPASTPNHSPTPFDSIAYPGALPTPIPDPRHSASRRRREQQHTSKCDRLPCLL